MGDGQHLRKRNGLCEGWEVWEIPRQGKNGGYPEARAERSPCCLLHAGASGPREVVIRCKVALGSTLEEGGGQSDLHNPAWSLGLWERHPHSKCSEKGPWSGLDSRANFLEE